MDMVPVDFKGPSPEIVAEAKIEETIAAEGYRPPPAYVRFARESGGTRFPSNCRFITNRDSGEIVGIGSVYHYDERVRQYWVKDVWEQTEGELPEGLLPIASTEFAGEVCLDFRATPEDPPVVLYDYEAMEGRAITRLAPDFAAFLEAIGPRPDA